MPEKLFDCPAFRSAIFERIEAASPCPQPAGGMPAHVKDGQAQQMRTATLQNAAAAPQGCPPAESRHHRHAQNTSRKFHKNVSQLDFRWN